MFQDSKLITGSIFDNIRLAKPDANLDEVMSALEKAQCMDIIEKFDSGVDTVIGSYGVYLSGGETQRVAMQEQFLKMHRLLFLTRQQLLPTPTMKLKFKKLLMNFQKTKPLL